jgi:tRNA nucleotidyltransferase/poly(A) polymerase
MLNQLRGVFESLHRHEVRYLVIGGIAAVLHGVPRATFDLDILVEATPENTRRLLDAFLEAGLGTAALTTPEELIANEITIFKDRVRVDVQTSTPGIDFLPAWEHRETMEYQGQRFFVVRRRDLIASKRASGRKVDLDDVRILELASDGETENPDRGGSGQ